MTLALIKATFGAGQRDINPSSSKPNLAQILREGANGADRIAADSRFHEETLAVATDAVKLAWEAESIEHVVSLAGNVTAPLVKVGSADTVAAGEYQIAADRRSLAFFASDTTSIDIAWIERINQAARQVAGNSETYVLVDQQTLLVKVDDGDVQTVLFETGDFGDIGNATAAEVAAVIDADLTDASSEDIGGAPVINSDTKGGGSSIEVTGGTANAALGFPTTKIAGAGLSIQST